MSKVVHSQGTRVTVPAASHHAEARASFAGRFKPYSECVKHTQRIGQHKAGASCSVEVCPELVLVAKRAASSPNSSNILTIASKWYSSYNLHAIRL
eukprot:1063791-Pleurochrysis_carterae.AAC.1